MIQKTMRAMFIILGYMALILVAKFAISGIEHRYFDPEDKNPTRYQIETLNCQYPARALNSDGTCDNSDPACPEIIKGGICPIAPPKKDPNRLKVEVVYEYSQDYK